MEAKTCRKCLEETLVKEYGESEDYVNVIDYLCVVCSHIERVFYPKQTLDTVRITSKFKN